MHHLPSGPAATARATPPLTKMRGRPTVDGRAIRRAGELLKQIEPSKGGRPTETRVDALPSFGRKEAAADAGLSPHQAKRATRVASIPLDDFETPGRERQSTDGQREWTMARIASALNVSQRQVSTDLSSLEVTSKPSRPKGGRPKKTASKPRSQTAPRAVEREDKVVVLMDMLPSVLEAKADLSALAADTRFDLSPRTIKVQTLDFDRRSPPDHLCIHLDLMTRGAAGAAVRSPIKVCCAASRSRSRPYDLRPCSAARA